MIDPKYNKDDLKKRLSELQYDVLVNEDTEQPFSGKYLENKDTGVYVCPVCGSELFKSKEKFDSGTGWPSFYDVANSKAVKLSDDSSDGMKRVKVDCATCGAHLGHVFKDQPTAPSGLRYCINSAALDFKPDKRAV